MKIAQIMLLTVVLGYGFAQEPVHEGWPAVLPIQMYDFESERSARYNKDGSIKEATMTCELSFYVFVPDKPDVKVENIEIDEIICDDGNPLKVEDISSSVTQENRIRITIDCAHPGPGVTAISRLRGGIQGELILNTKLATLNDPESMVGKYVQLPDAEDEMFVITEIDDEREFKIEYSKTLRDYLKRIYFVDRSGEIISERRDYISRSSSSGVTHLFALDKKPVAMKLVLWGDCKNARIAFAAENIPLPVHGPATKPDAILKSEIVDPDE